MTRLVLATRNPHKVGELRRILAETVPISASTCDPRADVPRSSRRPRDRGDLRGERPAQGDARSPQATGLAAVADDSGLASTSSAARPACSAPAGREPWGRHLPRAERDRLNLRLLLDQLADVPDEHRAPHFVCSAVLVLPDGRSAATVRPGHRAPGPRTARQRTVSATTRSSSRTASSAPRPSSPTRRRTPSRTVAGPSGPWRAS